MAETKKYFLDFGGLQTLWAKMKNTFASTSDVETLEGRIGTISESITGLEEDIQAVQDLTLSYKPKVVSKYSDAEAYNVANASVLIFDKEARKITKGSTKDLSSYLYKYNPDVAVMVRSMEGYTKDVIIVK